MVEQKKFFSPSPSPVWKIFLAIYDIALPQLLRTLIYYESVKKEDFFILIHFLKKKYHTKGSDEDDLVKWFRTIVMQTEHRLRDMGVAQL